ncbi:MAG: Uma2 family endonuclease [Isosphaeraceae bacterium]
MNPNPSLKESPLAIAIRPRPGPSPGLPPQDFKTVGELLDRLGNVPPNRVRLSPSPGTATESDLTQVNDREGVICELVDGVLLEKTIGFDESRLAALLIAHLVNFARVGDLGIVTGPDGPARLSPGQVRYPDVAFFSRERVRALDRKKRRHSIVDLAPDLAIEVLSKSNTRREMERKLHDYFTAGTRLVWYVDIRKRTVRVFNRPDHSTLLVEGQTLDGGVVLPGFTLPLRDLFAALD